MTYLKKAALVSLLALGPLWSGAANAALTLGATTCSSSDIGPAATSCTGWFSGNLNGGSATKKNDSAAAINLLLGNNALTGATLTWLEDLSGLRGNSVNFVTPLYGDTIVSFHVGGAGGQTTGVGYQSTAFFRFDAGSGLDLLAFNRAGLSNARLYSTGKAPIGAVPEPAAWAMMLFGFGGLGFSMRRKKHRLQLTTA